MAVILRYFIEFLTFFFGGGATITPHWLKLVPYVGLFRVLELLDKYLNCILQ